MKNKPQIKKKKKKTVKKLEVQELINLLVRRQGSLSKSLLERLIEQVNYATIKNRKGFRWNLETLIRSILLKGNGIGPKGLALTGVPWPSNSTITQYKPLGWYGLNPEIKKYMKTTPTAIEYFYVNSTDGFWLRRGYFLARVSVDGGDPSWYVLGGRHAYTLDEFNKQDDLTLKRNLGKELYCFIIRTTAHSHPFIASVWIKQDSISTSDFLKDCYTILQREFPLLEQISFPTDGDLSAGNWIKEINQKCELEISGDNQFIEIENPIDTEHQCRNIFGQLQKQIQVNGKNISIYELVVLWISDYRLRELIPRKDLEEKDVMKGNPIKVICSDLVVSRLLELGKKEMAEFFSNLCLLYNLSYYVIGTAKEINLVFPDKCTQKTNEVFAFNELEENPQMETLDNYQLKLIKCGKYFCPKMVDWFTKLESDLISFPEIKPNEDKQKKNFISIITQNNTFKTIKSMLKLIHNIFFLNHNKKKILRMRTLKTLVNEWLHSYFRDKNKRPSAAEVCESLGFYEFEMRVFNATNRTWDINYTRSTFYGKTFLF